MNKKYIGFMAGLLMLAGCSNDDQIAEQQAVDSGVKSFSSFTATINQGDTRAYIVDGEIGGPKKVSWDVGDEIAVMADNRDVKHNFTVQRIENNVGYFEGNEVEGESFIGIYAPTGVSVWDNNLNFYLEDDMHANTLGDFSFTGPMIAVSETNRFQFNQLTGLIHFTIGDLHRASFAILEGNNGEKLSGTFYVDRSKIEEGLQVYDGNEYGTATKSYLDEVSLTEDVMDVYFIVPPTMFSMGFTLEIEGGDGDDNWVLYKKLYNKSLTVNAGDVKHFTLVNVESEIQAMDEAKEAENKTKLMAIYNDMDGANWTFYNERYRWSDNLPLMQWEGVGLNDEGEVVVISLDDHNLTGPLSEAIGELTSLETLELSNNAITSLPESLENLVNLQHLLICNNQIGGQLPASIATLTNLVYLDMESNQFEGMIPDSYFNNLKDLEFINVRNNMLQGQVTPELQMSPMWQNTIEHWVDGQQPGYGIEIVDPVTAIILKDGIYTAELKKDETFQLEFTVNPETAWNRQVVYQDYDPAIISVDENGLITALSTGFTAIRIKAQDNNGAFEVFHVSVVESVTSDGNEKFDHQGQGW